MTHPRRLFLAAVLAATGTVAIAQTPSPAAPVQPAAGEWTQRMAERHAQRMADLKAKLNITPAQETAWNAYADAMQPPADIRRPRMSRDEFAQLNTPQRIDRMQAFSAERQQRMQQRGEAIKAFYAQLTPEQQQIYDQQAMRGGRGGKRGGYGMGHGGYGMGGGWR